jgi:hypothetical protein
MPFAIARMRVWSPPFIWSGSSVRKSEARDAQQLTESAMRRGSEAAMILMLKSFRRHFATLSLVGAMGILSGTLNYVYVSSFPGHFQVGIGGEMTVK